MGDYRGSGPAPTNGNRPPPEPTGELIARFHRPGLRGVPDAELRITLDSFQGRPFIGCRVWEAGQGGSWWPTKKGVSIKLSEAIRVADAIAEAAKIAADPDAVARVLERNEQVTRPDEAGGSPAHPRPRVDPRQRQAGPNSPPLEGQAVPEVDDLAPYRRRRA
jgi:hypothetical protein